MWQKKLVLVSALLGTLLAGGSGRTADHPAVFIDNFSFGPAEVSVMPGTEVTWTNRDDIPHTVTDAADNRAFKSAALDTGDSFSHVFEKAGIYHYFCSLHPHMQGTVVVN